MINKIMGWWVKVFYGACGDGAAKKSNYWSVLAANIMNMGIAMMISAIIINLYLKFFGLTSSFMRFILLTSTLMFVVYLLAYRIGITPKYLKSFNPEKTYQASKTKNMLNLIFILLCAFLMVPLMIFIISL